jgi:hypothetical protein
MCENQAEPEQDNTDSYCDAVLHGPHSLPTYRIITAVLHNVTVWWMNRFGLRNGTRLLKLITFGGGGGLLPGMLCG